MPGTFSEFLGSLDPDPARRGRQFEHFVKWFLTTDPEWSTQVDQVWLWDDWPERWGPDCGIDLIFRHRDGDIWAVQAKCYSPDHDITKHDVDKFLSESSRPQIHRRLLLATTDRIGKNARQVCEAQEKPVVRFLRSDFEKAEIDYPVSHADLTSAKRRPRPSPRDHQREAINAVVAGFQEANRGQLIMACGTGKTYVTLWVKEWLQAKRTLVLVPSLGLLSQILREWTFAAADPFEVLCVCSDKSVGARGSDEAIHSLADLAFPVTSDAAEIQRFLAGSGPRVVFSTYQSSLLVAEAQADPVVPDFDLAVADEAHRCAGSTGSDFTAILDPTTIRCDKRLFTTATPRTYSSTVHKRAEERGVEVVGMDNFEQFGAVLHALPFGKAIEDKLLTDYRVVIIGVDDPMIAQWITRRELVRTGTGVETDSESLAAQIGLLKSIQDYDLKRVISFHSRVSRAKTFADEVVEVMAWCDEKHRPTGSLRADFVSGEMPTGQRRNKLDQLRKIAVGERAVLSNARCLSEGVDVPSLDGVAFIDPRGSQVDIIQAVGRAIRLSADKKAGTIILPVFLRAGDEAIGAIEASNFKPIWDVLNALKAHDDVLACELDQIRTAMGRDGESTVSNEVFNKLIIDLPATVDANFSSSLRTHLVEQVTSSWNFWFGLLEAFVESEGHARVDRGYRTIDGFKLGGWVGKQRSKRFSIAPERRARLEALPNWSWDAYGDDWAEGLRYLIEFSDREGHSRVPRRYKTADGYRLDIWVGTQRAHKKSMTPERKARLEALPGWSWNFLDDAWDVGMHYLNKFLECEGHCKVAAQYVTADGYRLGAWVNRQRTNKDAMPPHRQSRLQNLPGWTWGARPSFDRKQWDEWFSYLMDFSSREGHAKVPTGHVTADGHRLGAWVAAQRRWQDSMLIDRKIRLEALPGWNWNAIDDAWETGFSYLKKFAEREGLARLTTRYKTADGYKLGLWVGRQRAAKDSMTPERKARLEALPGWSWNPFADAWEQGFHHLHAFVEREGHAKVPASHTTTDGYRLGGWVVEQRNSGLNMTPERKARLEALPGWSWNTLEDAWEQGFHHLQEFVECEGHAKVPASHTTTDGYRLGQWVRVQRNSRFSMTPERKARLETLPGWSWNTQEDAWEQGFHHLQEFVKCEGHAKVPKGHKAADGYAVGSWVNTQRNLRDRLTPDRKLRLEALPGWVWDVIAAQWEKGFRYLTEFAAQTGHCRVSQGFKTSDGYRLGRWVAVQRRHQESMSLERKARLETLPGWAWRISDVI